MALQRIRGVELPEPSALISSGGGTHVYWLLGEDVVVSDAFQRPIWCEYINKKTGEVFQKYQEDCVKNYFSITADGEREDFGENGPPVGEIAARFEDILNGLAIALGADTNCTDVARILRLPGTLNPKYAPPVPVQIVTLNDGKHPLSIFEDFLVPKERVTAVITTAVTVDVGDGYYTPGTETSLAGLEDEIEACAFAPKGLRSDRDHELIFEAIRQDVNPDVLWEEVQSISKFADRGRSYFDHTWQKASRLAQPRPDQDEAIRLFEEWYKDNPVTKEPMLNLDLNLIYTGDEFLNLADKDIIEWICEDILERGGFNIFSGKPYSGKSVVVSHFIGCCLEGRDFFGHKIKAPVPVLYVDTDRNRIKRIAQRIQRTASVDTIRKRFFFANVDKLPDVLTADWVKALVHQTTQGRSFNNLVVIIDTFRSAFLAASEKGAEADSALMMKTLKPLKRLVRQTNITLMVLHHDPKYSGEIAGSGAIPGVTDGVWGYSRDEAHGTLKIRTRDDKEVEPLKLTYGEQGLKVYDPDQDVAVLEEKIRKEKETEQKIIDICKFFPSSAAEALTLEEAMALKCFTGDSRATVQTRLKECERAGKFPRLERIGKGVKGDPLKWFAV